MTPRQTYTVYGFWPDTEERYGQAYIADSARDAEDQMLLEAQDQQTEFRIAGTLVGEHPAADIYTAYIDPEDPDNDAREDLEAVIAELEVCEWTILGLITADDDEQWNQRTGGQRHISHEMALSPRIAEDLARAAVAERGKFTLAVCVVLAGRKERCESYAFSNHDERVAR